MATATKKRRVGKKRAKRATASRVKMGIPLSKSQAEEMRAFVLRWKRGKIDEALSATPEFIETCAKDCGIELSSAFYSKPNLELLSKSQLSEIGRASGIGLAGCANKAEMISRLIEHREELIVPQEIADA